MSESRRRELLALASRNRCIVVEDDWAAGLSFDGAAPPTLHALDGGEHVVYLSTFAKKLLPGLRVGWIAAPPSVTERLMTLKLIRDCGTSPLLQAALHEFLTDGGLERHLDRVLPANLERRDCMLQALREHFPDGVQWTRPSGGLFLWVTLPRNFDGQRLWLEAQREGVRYGSGELFHGNADGRNTLRLTYSAASPAQIRDGVEILGRLIRQTLPGPSDSSSRTAAEPMPIV